MNYRPIGSSIMFGKALRSQAAAMLRRRFVATLEFSAN